MSDFVTKQPKMISKHSEMNVWVISFPFSRTIVNAIKEYIPGAWFEKYPLKAWYVPVDPEWVGRLAWFANQYGFYFDKRAYTLFHDLTVKNLNVERSFRDVQIPALTEPLHPFQLKGVARMIQEKCVLVGDEMGLGKSVQALAAAEGNDAYPHVIVTPATVKHKWGEEVKKWLPYRTYQILEAGDKNVQLDSDIVILNYDLLQKFKNSILKIEPQTITFDEGHLIKNRESRRSKTAKLIAAGIPNRYILSGTPIVNRTFELVSQLNILGRLNDFGGFWNFVHHFCGATKKYGHWDFSGSTNLELLNKNLHDICFFRRLKKDVISELPPLETTIIPMEIRNRKTYEDEEERLLRWLKREKENKTLSKTRGEQMVRIEKLKQMSANGKIDFAVEFIESFLEYEEKVVLFAGHKEIQQKLLEIYPDAAHILGTDSSKVRKEQNRRFQEDPDCDMIICSLKAASTGIDLFASSNVIFLELPWTPADVDQAIARLHRMGQQKPVNAWFLIAEQTIEEEIAQILDVKRMIVSKATEGYSDVYAVSEVVDSLLLHKLREVA